jgi:hypothetical protein
MRIIKEEPPVGMPSRAQSRTLGLPRLFRWQDVQQLGADPAGARIGGFVASRRASGNPGRDAKALAEVALDAARRRLQRQGKLATEVPSRTASTFATEAALAAVWCRELRRPLSDDRYELVEVQPINPRRIGLAHGEDFSRVQSAADRLVGATELARSARATLTAAHRFTADQFSEPDRQEFVAHREKLQRNVQAGRAEARRAALELRDTAERYWTRYWDPVTGRYVAKEHDDSIPLEYLLGGGAKIVRVAPELTIAARQEAWAKSQCPG